VTPATPAGATSLRTPAFLALLASALVFFISAGIVLPVAPQFATGPLEAAGLGFGVAIGAFSLGSLVARPVVGWWADRRGRRSLLIGGALVTAIALGLHVLVGALPGFVLVRLLLGVAEGAFLVAGLAMATDLAPPGRTGEAVSLASLSIYGGVALGPIIGDALLGAVGFNAVWIVATVVALVSALIAVAVPETRPERAPGATGGGRLFHPAGVYPGVIVLCATFGMAGFLTLIPLHTKAIGIGGAGPALALYGGIVMLIRFLGAKLPDRMGPVRLASMALLATAVGLVLIGALPGQVGLLVGTAVFAVGIGLSIPSILSFAVSRAPADERGSIVGTTSVFLDLSFGLAPVALAPIADAAGIPATFVVSALVAVAGAVLLLARRPAAQPATTPAG
jgi:predicted MFS family arabinose efflux permease